MIRTIRSEGASEEAAERRELAKRAATSERLFTGRDVQAFGRYLTGLMSNPLEPENVASAFRAWVEGPENQP